MKTCPITPSFCVTLTGWRRGGGASWLSPSHQRLVQTEVGFSTPDIIQGRWADKNLLLHLPHHKDLYPSLDHLLHHQQSGFNLNFNSLSNFFQIFVSGRKTQMAFCACVSHKRGGAISWLKGAWHPLGRHTLLLYRWGSFVAFLRQTTGVKI